MQLASLIQKQGGMSIPLQIECGYVLGFSKLLYQLIDPRHPIDIRF